MCGIVGYVGSRDSVEILMDGLRRLEYRGYDSAGVAVMADHEVQVVRAVGKLSNLSRALEQRPVRGSIGIGHTRWATHGRPSEPNAHPHVVHGTAVVHNGIIENHASLRQLLVKGGRKPSSDTDTEIVAHLIDSALSDGRTLLEAVAHALDQVIGAYAIAVVSSHAPDRIVVAKQGSPLVLGTGQGEHFCASDVPALLSQTRSMIFLEDGDLAELSSDGVIIRNQRLEEVERQPTQIHWSASMAEKEGYKHFMLKEIHEQPRALEDTLRGRLDPKEGIVVAEEVGLSEAQLRGVRRVIFLACGTSFHASMLGQRWVERISHLPASVELASEFRTRDPVVGPDDLVVAVSQSGETSDTLNAVKVAREKGALVLAVANVNGSAIPRASHAAFYTHAGPEIGVASTKCFSVQMVALLLLALRLAEQSRDGDLESAHAVARELVRVPQLVRETLAMVASPVQELAKVLVESPHVFFLGRGLSFPVALEGALKLKEVSYIHAEGYAAGEMKHGPIALVDRHLPVLMVMPEDNTFEKSASNLAEVQAREAITVGISSSTEMNHIDHGIRIPRSHPLLSSFLSVIPLQLFAYHVADMKGTDVDQPRNLAKTVTVE